jgi:hypothetical protein
MQEQDKPNYRRILSFDEKSFQSEFCAYAESIEDAEEAIQIGMLSDEEISETREQIKVWQKEARRIYDLLIDNAYGAPRHGSWRMGAY